MHALDSTVHAGARRAYTLIELLVVIGIIGALIAIAVVVGHQVIGGGKAKATADVIKTLEQALAAYSSGKSGVSVPATTRFPGSDPNHAAELAPLADAAVLGQDNREFYNNSLGLFIAEARGVREADRVLQGIPQRFMRDYSPNPSQLPAIPTVVDAWGNPIRFVHPAFDGVIVDQPSATNPSPIARRKIEDVLDLPPPGKRHAFSEIRRAYSATSPAEADLISDGGTCVGDRPYFYSLGPDGKAGFEKRSDGSVVDYNADNVYVTRPNLPKSPF